MTPEAISSRHRAEQEALTRIAVALRGERKPDELLARAARVQPAEGARSNRQTAPGNYFIGRCLQRRGDKRARRYLAACVRRDPLHWRGWAALAASFVMRRRA